ncbi:MAG: signal peptidase I [Oscillospiraceae bacterium]|nr:signal peptidase I [Oscillospiraceae bacterium]
MADRHYQGKRLEGVKGARLESRRERSAPPAEVTHRQAPTPPAEEVIRERVAPPAGPESAAPAAENAPERAVPVAESVTEAVASVVENAVETAAAEAGHTPEPPAPAAENTPEPPATAEEAAAEQPVPAAEQAEQSGEAGKKKKGFWADYGYLVITAAVVILVFRVLLQLAFVPTASMESTVPTNSLLVSWQLPYLVSDPEPARGSIVTFWSEELGKLLVKRVIGLPGEEITFVDGFVCINGERIPEPYLDQQGATTSAQSPSFRVPEGCLFVMGDNRSGSQDSRYWKDPYVPLANVRAQALLCIPVKYQPVKILPKWKGLPLPIVNEIHTVT